MRWAGLVRYVVVGVALCSIAFSAGCNHQDNLGFVSEGVGTNLYSSDVQRQYQIQQLYYGYLCGQAGLPQNGSSRGIPSCDFADFHTYEWNTLVQAGLNDIDQRCDAYLAWYDSRKRSQKPLISQINTTGRLVNAILQAYAPTSAAIGVVAEAFGFAEDSVNNYNSRLLYEIDTSTLQALVLNNQGEFRNGIVDIKFQTKPAVEHALRSYLRICMPFSIETEVNNVLTVIKRGGGDPGPLITPQSVEAAVDATGPRKAEEKVIVERITVPVLPPQSAEVRKLFIPETYGDADLMKLQVALCVPRDELGKVGPRTRVSYAIFEDYMAGRPGMKADGKISNRKEYASATKNVTCSDSYKNIFEAEQLSDPRRVSALSGAMKLFNVPGFVDLGAKASDLAAMRANIIAANAFFQTTGSNGADSDEVTPALFRKMKIAF
ncbi:hypothetical protein O7A70_19945 [Mesorhizobium sp. Cs1299R1N1]|uniref:hypothetical protein n=1 Tax=Mesorhizobium sp. Cs1299R1N1 TaxID=3015172 RepID=UPI00301BCDA4